MRCPCGQQDTRLRRIAADSREATLLSGTRAGVAAESSVSVAAEVGFERKWMLDELRVVEADCGVSMVK